MKYLFLLFLSFNAFAMTPEACLENTRSRLLLLEAGAIEQSEKQRKVAVEKCFVHVDENYEKVIALIEADTELQELYERVESMGLIY